MSISKSNEKNKNSRNLEDTIEKKDLGELIEYSMHLMDMSRSTANHQLSINEQFLYPSEKPSISKYIK